MTLCSIHFTLWRIAVGFTGFFRHIKRIETIWKHVYDDDLVSQHCKVFHQCSLFMYWTMICSIDSTLVCLKSAYYIIEFHNHIFPQIASAIGVLTSRIGVRVRRFVGFVLGGGCRAGCRLRCRSMCAWVRVGRFWSVLGGGLAPRFVKEC